jgi:hypothetical protein
MNIRRKLFAVLLVLVMMLSLAASVSAEENQDTTVQRIL